MNVKKFDKNVFETRTDILFLCRGTGGIALVLLPLFIYYSYLTSVSLLLCIIIWVLLSLLMAIIPIWKQHTTLVFHGDTLSIILHWNKEMVTYTNVGQNAFTYSQTKLESKRGLGTIYILGTDLVIRGVRNFDLMQQYILTHFPERGNT